MAAFASLLAASAVRIASTNLCADEYLLLLARPGEIASVTRLAQDPLESPLWRIARRYPANRSDIESLIPARPAVVLTMGGGARDRAGIARRMGWRPIALESPTDVAGVERNLRLVAKALGDPVRAQPWLAAVTRLRQSTPKTRASARWVGGGGVGLSRNSPALEWLALAGYDSSEGYGQVSLEDLAISPPKVLLRSDYRSGQMSAGNAWLDHPIVRRLRDRTVRVDGRRFTCAGPLMIAEVERLRRGHPR